MYSPAAYLLSFVHIISEHTLVHTLVDQKLFCFGLVTPGSFMPHSADMNQAL